MNTNKISQKNSLITRHIFTPLDAINQIEKKMQKQHTSRKWENLGQTKKQEEEKKKLND